MKNSDIKREKKSICEIIDDNNNGDDVMNMKTNHLDREFSKE